MDGRKAGLMEGRHDVMPSIVLSTSPATRLHALIARQWPLLTPDERLEVEEMQADGETALLRELV